MERYICDLCNCQLKISHGDFLFKYHSKCKNGHENKNLSFKDLLKKRKLNENSFKCQEHQKFCQI